MPSDVGIRVDGLNEVVRELRKLEKGLDREIRLANKEAAEEVKPVAVAEAPKRSGRLAKSIAVRASTRRASLKAGTSTRVPYAGPIHWGWPRRNIRRNEFLTRAVNKKLSDVVDKYVKRIEGIIDRFNRG